jgi:hypothetical protein
MEIFVEDMGQMAARLMLDLGKIPPAPRQWGNLFWGARTCSCFLYLPLFISKPFDVNSNIILHLINYSI